MKRALFASELMLSVMAFAGVSAQSTRHDLPGPVTFAIGSNASQIKDGSDFGAPIIAQLGFEKRFEGSLFSWRVEANGYQSSNDGMASPSRTRSVGLALIPVYSFSAGPTRPYVLGAVGFDRFSSRSYHGAFYPPGFGFLPAGSTLKTANTADFGIGAGILRRVGDGWYYAEVRGEVFTGQGFQRFRVPVTFGMRF